MVRKRFTKEFKLEAIRLSEQSEKKKSQIARDLGIRPELLYRWIEDYRKNPQRSFPGNGKSKDADTEVFQLRKELADVRMERDILKKAVSIFSKTDR